MMVPMKASDIFNGRAVLNHEYILCNLKCDFLHDFIIFSKSNRGVFVAFSKIVMAWGSN